MVLSDEPNPKMFRIICAISRFRFRSAMTGTIFLGKRKNSNHEKKVVTQIFDKKLERPRKNTNPLPEASRQ